MAVRGAVRRPHIVRERFGSNEGRLEAVPFDFDGSQPPPSLFQNVAGILLIRPPQVGDVKDKMFPFLRAAREAGVSRIVFLSLLGAQWIPFIPHRKLEKEIRRLGFDYTFVRAGFFMQNLENVLAGFIRNDHELPVPAGESRTSFVDARDLGEAAARLLLSDTPPRTVELTGTESLTYHDVARILTKEIGTTISYTKPRTSAFTSRATASGWDPSYTTLVSRLYLTVRLGMASKVTDDLGKLLGRPPRLLSDYVSDRREVWLRAGA
jgi:uncharacterized protein YbjT (DUF2867 family)